MVHIHDFNGISRHNQNYKCKIVYYITNVMDVEFFCGGGLIYDHGSQVCGS